MSKEDCKCPFNYSAVAEHIDKHYGDACGVGCCFVTQIKQLRIENEKLKTKIDRAIAVGFNKDCMFCGFKDKALKGKDVDGKS